ENSEPIASTRTSTYQDHKESRGLSVLVEEAEESGVSRRFEAAVDGKKMEAMAVICGWKRSEKRVEGRWWLFSIVWREEGCGGEEKKEGSSRWPSTGGDKRWCKEDDGMELG
ncbi:hypothetical protein HAX54_023644, partial [Datura stramonium]|nr:hypothetical protein [Datura stramonium]